MQGSNIWGNYIEINKKKKLKKIYSKKYEREPIKVNFKVNFSRLELMILTF